MTEGREQLQHYVQLFLHTARQGIPISTAFIDVACQVLRHLAKFYSGSPSLMGRGYVVPLWHKNMHQAACREVQGILRHQLGAGTADGEGSERIWAWVSGFTASLRSTTFRHYVGGVDRLLVALHVTRSAGFLYLAVLWRARVTV